MTATAGLVAELHNLVNGYTTTADNATVFSAWISPTVSNLANARMDWANGALADSRTAIGLHCEFALPPRQRSLNQAGNNDPRAVGTNSAKAAERRARILDALRRCILGKGYSATSFNELAQEADMSPSHVFYYFPGKDAALKALYQDLAESLITSVTALRGLPPEEQFRVMADFAFSGEVFSHDERQVFTELIAQSLHNASVREIRDGLTSTIVQYLTGVYESCDRADGQSAEDAGLAAAAMGVGLVLFCCCDQISPAQARVQLHEGLLKIGGFPPLQGSANAPAN